MFRLVVVVVVTVCTVYGGNKCVHLSGAMVGYDGTDGITQPSTVTLALLRTPGTSALLYTITQDYTTYNTLHILT